MLNKEYRIHRYSRVALITALIVLLIGDMTFSLHSLRLTASFPEPVFLTVKIVLLELAWVSIAPICFMAENRRQRLRHVLCTALISFIHGCIFQRICYVSWGSAAYPSWGLREMMPPVERHWYLLGIVMTLTALFFQMLAHISSAFKNKPYPAAAMVSVYYPLYWGYLWSPAFLLLVMRGCNYIAFQNMDIRMESRAVWWENLRQYIPTLSSWMDLFTEEGRAFWEAIGAPAPGMLELLGFPFFALLTFVLLAVVIPVAVQLQALRFRDDESVKLDPFRKRNVCGFVPGKDFETAKRVILCVTPQDILDQAAVSFQWTRMIRRYGGFGRDASGVLGFRIDEDYVLCPYAYALLSEDMLTGKEKICMLARRDTYLGSNLEMIVDYDRRQYRLMEEYLLKKEKEGFQTFIWERTYGQNALQKNHVLTVYLYGERPVLLSGEEVFPLEQLHQLASIRENRKIELAMFRCAGEAGEQFLQRQFGGILSGEGTAARFYDLMKIAEYCIHVRALIALSDPEGKRCEEGELQHLSLGMMQHLQREKTRSGDVAHLVLVKALKGLRGDPVKKRSAGINLCTQTIVFLRNKYVGHGTMIYHVTETMLRDLDAVVHAILVHFLQNPHDIHEQSMIMPERFERKMPAVKNIDGKPWYFSRICQIRDVQCIDYLEFDTGRHRFFAMTGEPVKDTFELDRGMAPDAYRLSGRPDDLPPIPRRKVYEVIGAPLFTRVTYADDTRLIDDLFAHFPRKMVIFGGADFDCKVLFGHRHAGKRYDEEILHHLALLARSPVSLIMIGGRTWDEIIEENVRLNASLGTQEAPAFMEDMATLALAGIFAGNGTFLPWSEIRIVVFGECRYSELVRNPFPWIRLLQVIYFETPQDALQYGLSSMKSSSSGFLQTMASGRLPTALAGTVYDLGSRAAGHTALGDRMIRARYETRGETYLRIIRELDMASPLLYANENIFSSGFIRNILAFPDVTTAVIALFDYMEFTVLTMWHYVRCVHEVEGRSFDEDAAGHPIVETTMNEEKSSAILANFKMNAQEILYYMPQGAPCYDDIHYGVIAVPERLKALHRKLDAMFSTELTSDKITFSNLLGFVGALRNITKGHGYIRGRDAEVIWEILLYDAMMLNRFLHVDAFAMNAYECVGNIVFGYPDMHYAPGYQMMMEHHVACPLYSIDRRRGMVYMNYFEGKVTIPEGSQGARGDGPFVP